MKRKCVGLMLTLALFLPGCEVWHFIPVGYAVGLAQGWVVGVSGGWVTAQLCCPPAHHGASFLAGWLVGNGSGSSGGCQDGTDISELTVQMRLEADGDEDWMLVMDYDSDACGQLEVSLHVLDGPMDVHTINLDGTQDRTEIPLAFPVQEGIGTVMVTVVDGWPDPLIVEFNLDTGEPIDPSE